MTNETISMLVTSTNIIIYTQSAQIPERFTTSPILAIEKALKQNGLTIKDIDYWDVNEAFALFPILLCKN
eukprot:maker-scaffold_57-snap-gene-1.3-mRNA-1 protein AED:0.51 eAED:0.52 QI:0/0/0/0.5/0/0/2/0/69